MKKDTIHSCEELGKAIRDLRRSQGVTQAQLAGLSNTGVRFISDLGKELLTFVKSKETCQTGKMLHVLAILGVDIVIKSPYDKD